ncbi:hypothetical protein JYU29_05705 [Tianweitania sp. BSSL-BM11]|uniref:Uncharacterized protein n=1 Tax=Tianweitania aestuarii TaxID=2814886 RepID=A0ABS5RV77_9HYPH|nr:hypothetical protein [Tianweitania aestuarii]MBS9720181.1 hypothetical protein [Tianweitania aestuarii]
MNRTFKRSWRYHDKELGSDRIIPAGWQGDLPDAVAKAADKDGVTLIEKAKGSPKVSDEVAAARKAVTAAEKALKIASTDDAKADAEAKLRDAEEAHAALEG